MPMQLDEPQYSVVRRDGVCLLEALMNAGTGQMRPILQTTSSHRHDHLAHGRAATGAASKVPRRRHLRTPRLRRAFISGCILATTVAVGTARGGTYDYAGKDSTTGQRNNSWNAASSWTNGPGAFPNAAGDVARAPCDINGEVALFLNQDITIGTLNWSGSVLEIRAGQPAGKLILNNAGTPATWRMGVRSWLWMDMDLVLKDNLTLTLFELNGLWHAHQRPGAARRHHKRAGATGPGQSGSGLEHLCDRHK